MTYYLGIVFAVYFLTLVILIMGFDRAVYHKKVEEKIVNFISIVIAVRNEERNIFNVLNSIVNGNYPKEKFEVIVVDDHSEDRTVELANGFFKQNKIGRTITLAGNHGKKAALALGIDNSKGSIIATTDADCFVPILWLHRINEIFQNENTQMGVGAVKIESDGKLFSSLQSLEFSSVIGSGISTLGWGLAIMCNGANLTFRKKVFLEVKGYEGNLNYASGDDQFLMDKISQHAPDAVRCIPFPDAVVSTLPMNSLGAFFNQRFRWAGKWVSLPAFSKVLAVFIFLVQVSWLLLVFSFLKAPILMSIIMISKILLEFIFLRRIQRFLSMPFQSFPFLLLQFWYAPYVIVTAIISQFRAFRWKGRK